ncbi:MAG: hypothetical protein M0Z39_08485, partial [Actinomycetota bacterium]|nr:hypothetical protein [Actinomycetota bacterium]
MTEVGSVEEPVSDQSESTGTFPTASRSELFQQRRKRGVVAKYGIVIAWFVEIAIFAAIETSSFFT